MISVERVGMKVCLKYITKQAKINRPERVFSGFGGAGFPIPGSLSGFAVFSREYREYWDFCDSVFLESTVFPVNQPEKSY